MKLLAEGTCEELPGNGYRLVRNHNNGKPVAVFGPVAGELGHEMLMERPVVMRGIAKAKEAGYHVMVSGVKNRHPLYGMADEFWGIRSFRMDESWTAWYEQIKKEKLNNFRNASDLKFVSPKCWNNDPKLNESCWPLPRPSSAASEMAKKIAGNKRLVTICTRHYDRPRDFHAWQEYVSQLRGLCGPELKIISVTPKQYSVILSGTEYLQDLVGINDHLDVELALHALASCCVTTNTGGAGVMIYANAKTLLVLDGTVGHQPGWHGMNDLVSKENGVSPTEIIEFPSHVFKPIEYEMELAVRVAKKTKEVLDRT